MNKDDGKILVGWVCVVLIMFCLCLPTKCAAQAKAAQIDTVLCKTECIVKLMSTTTEKGKTRLYAVYKDPSADIEEIISISKTTMDYINMCKQNGIRPSLGIRLRNGVISSIIRIKPKYIRHGHH